MHGLPPITFELKVIRSMWLVSLMRILYRNIADDFVDPRSELLMAGGHNQG